MDLKIKHLKENNKLTMILGFLVQAFLLAATVLYREGRTFSTVVMLVVEIICVLVSIIGFITLGGKKQGYYPLLLSLAADYMMILLGSFHTPYLWAFGTLIGMIVIVYHDKTITALACGVAVLENLIFVIIYYAAKFNEQSSSRFMVPTNIAFIMLFCIITFIVSWCNSRQTGETMADIEHRSNEQLLQAAKVQETSVKVAEKLENADRSMQSLSEKVHSSSDAVSRISDSVTKTAEAIKTQTQMNASISASLDNIAEESEKMEDLTDIVKANVNTGNDIVSQLQMQAKETALVNSQTSEMTQELSASAETVKNIVGSILAISSQTNLLALNASIEAARAGEAGRGFAVVAEEIRNLSEDTKKSAEMISATIDQLIASVNAASANMNRSVEYSNRQGELIAETGSKFSEIFNSVNELSENVEIIVSNVSECAEATSKVVDAISNLSAMNEQVAASSDSSLFLSNQCVHDMDETNRILGDILELTRES